MAKASPFDFVKAIGQMRTDPVADEQLDIRDYSPWIVNRALSLRVDAIEAVQLVNERSSLSKLGQYKILKAIIPKRNPNRSEFWIKAPKSEDLDFLKTYYGIGDAKAQEIYDIIGTGGITTLRDTLGGEEKKTRGK